MVRGKVVRLLLEGIFAQIFFLNRRRVDRLLWPPQNIWMIPYRVRSRPPNPSAIDWATSFVHPIPDQLARNPALQGFLSQACFKQLQNVFAGGGGQQFLKSTVTKLESCQHLCFAGSTLFFWKSWYTYILACTFLTLFPFWTCCPCRHAKQQLCHTLCWAANTEGVTLSVYRIRVQNSSQWNYNQKHLFEEGRSWRFPGADKVNLSFHITWALAAEVEVGHFPPLRLSPRHLRTNLPSPFLSAEPVWGKRLTDATCSHVVKCRIHLTSERTVHDSALVTQRAPWLGSSSTRQGNTNWAAAKAGMVTAAPIYFSLNMTTKFTTDW